MVVSRLAAIQARSYQINKNGSGEFLNVTYRGSVDKSQVKESVDCVPRDILVNVLEGIYASNREALRYVDNFALAFFLSFSFSICESGNCLTTAQTNNPFKCVDLKICRDYRQELYGHWFNTFPL